ncbi:MAG: hypothetical protein JKY94_01040 [Rhodobacteraceae bacterium]|nr:hypothetical protein [Paracoccaceae bacterium]
MGQLKRLGDFNYTEIEAHKALEISFNETFVFWWPMPQLQKPKWWHWSARKMDRRAERALDDCGFGLLTDSMREAYWKEVHTGQGYDDASGRLWREWAVMLGYMEPDQAFVSPSTGERQ